MPTWSRPEAVSQITFFITLVASTLLMGSSFVAGKILIQNGFSPMILVGWRFLVAAIATLPLVLLDAGSPKQALFPRQAGLRDLVLVVLIGLVQTAAVMGLLFWAMQFVSASTAAILLFTNPIWVAVLGRLFLGETLHRGRVAGLFLGVIGVGFAIGLSPDMLAGGETSIGAMIGISSALCWATATIINKRANLPLGPWALTFWQMLIGSFAVLGLAYSRGEHWPSAVTAEQWGWFLWLAIPASTGSFGLWFVALKKGGAMRASGFLFLAPLFTVTLSYLTLGTTLSWLQAFGGILIATALWLLNGASQKRKRQHLRDENVAGLRP